jgi:hypothetical protein
MFTVAFFCGTGNNKAEALTDDSTLTTTVLEYLSFSLTAGDSVSFGNLTPGTPIAAPATGTVASVTTSASNGYTLAVHDGEAGSNSSMTHTDTVTKITDFTLGDITTPVVWGAGTGVGITLFAADTSKEAKWGTGTTYSDALNKYAAIPQIATVAHTVTGFHEGADTSSWAFKIDVPNTQKTGAYSGTVTFTATAAVS